MTAVVAPDVDTIDLFAGPGGWDEALRVLGIRGVLGFEIDPDACATAEAAGHRRVPADVASLDPRAVARSDMIAPGGVRRLIASPPCQGFSTAGKGRGRSDTPFVLDALDLIDLGFDPTVAVGTLYGQCADDRTALVLEPLRWVLELLPEMTCWEQVPAVLPLWERCAQILRDAGYSAWAGILNAEQYGVPQTRRRAILIASRVRDVEPPPVTHSRYYPTDPTRLDPDVPSWVSMADALGWDPGDLVGFPCRADGQDAVQIDGESYRARDLRSASLPAFALTEKSRSWQRWVLSTGVNTATVGPGAERDEAMRAGRWRDIHKAQERPIDRPAPTVDGKAPGAWRVHEQGQRHGAQVHRVTLEEAAALQSFRPDYPWQGTRTSRCRQVGDAIPPLLGAHVIAAAEGLALPWVEEGRVA